MTATTWELLYGYPKPRTVKYIRSILSYLDILGFRRLIETRTAGEISRILRILGESVKPDSMFKDQKIQFTRFSDTVIRSMPEANHYPWNFIFELRSVLQAQIALIPQGIPIRGAITIGDAVQSWGRVYGPAVIRAYELENQKGAPPRIIIDDEALARLLPAIKKEGLDSTLGRLLRQEGSKVYLDYLVACEAELNVPEQEYPIFLALHRELILNGLTQNAGRPEVLAKYEWLRGYHERVVRDRFGTNAPRHLCIDPTA
jgi:hypothetical protein